MRYIFNGNIINLIEILNNQKSEIMRCFSEQETEYISRKIHEWCFMESYGKYMDEVRRMNFPYVKFYNLQTNKIDFATLKDGLSSEFYQHVPREITLYETSDKTLVVTKDKIMIILKNTIYEPLKHILGLTITDIEEIPEENLITYPMTIHLIQKESVLKIAESLTREKVLNCQYDLCELQEDMPIQFARYNPLYELGKEKTEKIYKEKLNSLLKYT